MKTMDCYLMEHWKDYIFQELNRRLADGEFSEIVHRDVKSERITPEECFFREISYWRVNPSDFMIDIDARVELKVQTEDGLDTEFYLFHIGLWFSFIEEDGVCEFDQLCLLENKPSRRGQTRLDSYLVPMLRWDEVERHAERMWETYYWEASRDPSLRQAAELAKRMHLHIVQKRLYKRPETRSILFFKEGTVLVDPPSVPGQHIQPPPIEEKVPESTIVLNVNSDGSTSFDLDIYHECAHDDYHFLVFRLSQRGCDEHRGSRELHHSLSP